MNPIYTRVSIRKYQDRPVEKEKTMAILRAAMQSFHTDIRQRRSPRRTDLTRAAFTLWNRQKQYTL